PSPRISRPPSSPLFPYTTLFRSAGLGLPFAVAFISSGFLALCLIAARLGVARPDLDVFFIVVKRPAHKDQDLPGLSFSGVLMQADRKSTRLNSSHVSISYAVFCL